MIPFYFFKPLRSTRDRENMIVSDFGLTMTAPCARLVQSYDLALKQINFGFGDHNPSLAHSLKVKLAFPDFLDCSWVIWSYINSRFSRYANVGNGIYTPFLNRDQVDFSPLSIVCQPPYIVGHASTQTRK